MNKFKLTWGLMSGIYPVVNPVYNYDPEQLTRQRVMTCNPEQLNRQTVKAPETSP